MSRGYGVVQQRILYAAEAASGVLFRNKLMWDMAEESGAFSTSKLRGKKTLRISSTFENTFQRALNNIEKSDLIIQKRKFESISELSELFIFKTNWVDVKNLRVRLLPFLKEYCEADSALRFSPAVSENYMINRMISAVETDFEKIVYDWAQLERTIVEYVATTDAFASLNYSKWLDIISRGRELFVPGKTKNESLSLGTLISDLKNRFSGARDERELIIAVEAFYQKSFPQAVLRNSDLKSRLYSAVDLGQGATPSLQENFKTFLLDKDSDFITSLPGHSVPTPLEGWEMLTSRPSFSYMLDYLVDRKAISAMTFILRPSH